MLSFDKNKITRQAGSANLLFLLASLLIVTSSVLHASNERSNEIPSNNLNTIVVTLKPIYSLVAHLTDGISTPILFSNNMQSPHHHNILPSERRLIANADMIIWLGPQMETYLSKIIPQQNSAITISLMQVDSLHLLNKRSKHSHIDHHQNSLIANNIDQHIWLSVNNVKVISRHISKKLIIHDPKNTARYKQNLEKLLDKIEKTDNEIKTLLKNHKQPFIASHDAFQYFEKEYELNFIAALNSGDDTSTSLKHLKKIKSLIKKNKIQCLIYQQPKPDIINTLTRKTDIKTTALDPLGINLSNSNNYHNAWFEIMQKLAINFKQCLSQ